MQNYTWRILLVDDDEDDYFLTRELLSSIRREKYILEWCPNFDDGQKLLENGDFDAALVDYDLGLRSGVEFIRRAVETGCTVPLLMVTGRGSYEVDLEAMQAGAQDYLSKGDLNPALLERAIRYAIERKSSETALAKANLEMQRSNMALKEARSASEQAAQEAKQAARESRAASIRMETIINNLTDVVLVYDKDDHVILANSFAIALLGFDPLRKSREVLFSMLSITTVDGSIVPIQNMPASRARSGEVVLNFPVTMQNPRGRKYHILISAMPLYIGHEYLGVVTVWNDMTEAWKSQLALKKSEAVLRNNEILLTQQKRALETTNQQLQGLFDHAPAGMVLYDAEPPYKVLMHNRIFQEFWPEPFYSQGMLGKYITDFAPLAEESGIMAVYREAARTGEGQTLYNTPYDGMPRGRTWWNWTVTPVFEEGRLVAFAHMLIETTDQVLARQRIEKELEERTLADERLQLATATAGLGVWDWDIVSGRVSYDSRARALYGLSPQADTAEDFFNVVDPRDRPILQQANAHLLGAQESSDLEYRVIWPDGSPHWVFGKARSVMDAQGKIVRVVGVAMDITGRKQAEAERDQILKQLEAERSRLETILESMPVAIWISDAEGRILKTNHEADVIWRGSAPLVQSVEEYRAYPGRWPETGQPLRPEEWPLIVALREGRRTANVEIEIERFDGTTGSVLVSGAPFYDSSGQMIGGVAIDQDITERKQLERALRQSEERFRVALQNVPIAVFTTDRDLRYTWAYNLRFGITAEMVIGKRDDELIPAKEAAELIALKQAVIASGSPSVQEIEFTVGGEAKQFIISLEPLRGPDGTVTGLIGTSLDVTRQRLLENKQVEIRTQMEVQHSLLEHRENERHTIARDIHDGPVQTLIGTLFNIQSAKSDIQDAETIQLLDNITGELRVAVQELRATINDLRPPVLIRFGLSRAIQIHIEDIRARYPDLAIDLDLVEDENLLPEETCLALYRVYQEGLNNVLRHANAKKVWIRYYPARDQMVLDIRDDGAGFTLPTDWLDLTRTNHFGLIGIKERVEMLGGTLNLTTAPGQGSQLRISVPIKKK